MSERKAITKKLRFEVLKRDSFTCQYCGRMAPDVLLEIDHIKPVAKGGKNTITNLITSCRDCNRGKSDKELSDNSAISVQQQQLKDINEKREQLKLMMQWKEELDNFMEEQIDQVNKTFNDGTNFSFTSIGRTKVKKWIEQFGLIEVIESTLIAKERYFSDLDKGEKAFNYIPRIAACRRTEKSDPTIKYKNYIKAILRNNDFYINEIGLKTILSYINDEDDFNALKKIAVNSRNWTDFREKAEKWIGGEYDER